MDTDADEARAAAKRPVTVLAGPYGHPFHPLTVTVPIGAWVGSLVFDLASRWADDPVVFAAGARWLIALGVLAALVAASLGFLDLLAIPRATRAVRIAYTHMTLNLVVVGLYAAGFVLRDADGPVGWGLIALSAVALALLGAAGWLGGMLAYRYGVRVADEDTQRSGFRPTKEG